MNIQQIQIEGKNIPVHKFLDDQMIFLTDASIICRGFHNIMNHDNNCGVNFLKKLQTLYNIIYNRYLLILTLSDTVVGKQEIQILIGKILQDIDGMKENYGEKRV